MRLALLLLLFAMLPVAAAAAEAEDGDPDASPGHVILLHGLARSGDAMKPLESRLVEAGYTVRNLTYPSTELSPDELDAYLHAEVVACCREAPRLHFVTHSLGGILVRAYLARHETPNLGRVVMLAPPNRGSEIVDVLGSSAPFRWTLGPTAGQLGTDSESLPNRLPPPDFEVGIIAGTRSINPLGAFLVPGEDDGTVSVASTKLDGMTDFITLPVSHTFIMYSDDAAEQTLAFLRTGRFRRP